VPLPRLDVVLGLAAPAMESLAGVRADPSARLVTTKRVSVPRVLTSTRAMMRSTRVQIAAPSWNSLWRRSFSPFGAPACS